MQKYFDSTYAQPIDANGHLIQDSYGVGANFDLVSSGGTPNNTPVSLKDSLGLTNAEIEEGDAISLIVIASGNLRIKHGLPAGFVDASDVSGGGMLVLDGMGVPLSIPSNHVVSIINAAGSASSTANIVKKA